MAFTVTMLSWSVLEYQEQVTAAGEFGHALEAIKWGTDYFIKAHTAPNVFWAQVGDGGTDHYCWQSRRHDDSRQAYKIDAEHPGSESRRDRRAMAPRPSCSDPPTRITPLLLLQHAEQLFEFGDKYRGKYDGSVRVVKSYYPSVSGYYDELLWAALWLHRATGDVKYLDYAVDNAEAFGGTTWAVSEFSWDIKYAGVQVLASK
ncbi:Endoglucanase 5, partial [Ananas comosus]